MSPNRQSENAHLWREIYLPLLWYAGLPLVLAVAGQWQWALLCVVIARVR